MFPSVQPVWRNPWIQPALRACLARSELLALPVSVGLEMAKRAISQGRSKGSGLAGRDAYPCRVLRLGKCYRVITEDLLRVLGITELGSQPDV